LHYRILLGEGNAAAPKLNRYAAQSIKEAALQVESRKERVLEESKKHYWQIRLTELKEVLEANNFEVFIAENSIEAKEIVLKDLLPRTGSKSVSYGGSITFRATGLYKAVKNTPGLEFIEPFEEKRTPEGREKRMEMMRQSLLVDLYITGTNAVTETGKLVNLDMFGNRVAGITFGPRTVVILIGRNKIVPDLEAAMFRVKNYVAPVNAMHEGQNTPCTETSHCSECKSPDRICNVWSIIEKCFPKGRIKVILVNEDLGL